MRYELVQFYCEYNVGFKLGTVCIISNTLLEKLLSEKLVDLEDNKPFFPSFMIRIKKNLLPYFSSLGFEIKRHHEGVVPSGTLFGGNNLREDFWMQRIIDDNDNSNEMIYYDSSIDFSEEEKIVFDKIVEKYGFTFNKKEKKIEQNVNKNDNQKDQNQEKKAIEQKTKQSIFSNPFSNSNQQTKADVSVCCDMCKRKLEKELCYKVGIEGNNYNICEKCFANEKKKGTNIVFISSKQVR